MFNRTVFDNGNLVCKTRGYVSALSSLCMCGRCYNDWWLYSRFLPIYVATGKHQYVKIVLGMMENFYMKLPPKILHLVRLNHTVPLYEGVDRDGTLMAFWAHDAIIEL